MEPKTNTLNIRVTDKQKRALKAIADDRRVSVSEVARAAIQIAIDTQAASNGQKKNEAS